nr:immunoglobulin light chain junction region [Macaca mulatta]MOX17362.1 immunoglobulin light chain junction region [Macaca mulatta]MOX17767.1 immunoglobulin light chain junction region [Macaca mulatta]MOX18033.1 immunoglobulin light chain junction region [Macaca mulatta]MOX18192.1 immunoglobulin light chain junction region [Macaca mulatta]
DYYCCSYAGISTFIF